MYHSLYRKYRPKSFDEVVGQEIVVRTLKNSIKNNRLSHAYLFAGPRGTGKTSIAKILAKTINCENLDGVNPCDNCNNCIQTNNKQSIDIIEIDAASNNGIDEIREINNKVKLVPSIGKYKIYIIDEVHMLTTGAFNALLKTLEEPPSHIVFVLATTEPHKIPTTILSRCQRFDFKKINFKEIFNRLKFISEFEKIKISDDALEEIARLSDGGMRDALSLLDQAIAYADNDIKIEDIHDINGTINENDLYEFVKAIINKDLDILLKKIDNFDCKGKDFIKLTEEIIIFLRNILVNITIDKNECEIDVSQEEILNIIKSFNSTFYEIKTSNSPKIMFEISIIELLNKNSEHEKVKIIEKNNKENTINEKELKENTISEQKVDNYNLHEKELSNDLKKLEKIRINNALCNLDKNTAILLKEKIFDLKDIIIDNYAVYYSMILEGKLTAFGNNILIFVFESNILSDEFNKNIISIEEMLKKYLKNDYKVISTYQEEWNKIKKDYSINKNNYKMMKEPIMIDEKINDIDSMFENIIEYS